MRYHIEAKHFPGTFQYPCMSCGKSLNSKISFRDHARFCKGGLQITPSLAEVTSSVIYNNH